MGSDTLMFAAIFLIAIVVICAGVVMVALNRVGSSSRARRRHKASYRAPTHRTFKDVV